MPDLPSLLLKNNGMEPQAFWDKIDLLVKDGWDPPIAWMTELIKLIQESSTITAIIIGDGEEKNLYVSQAKKYGIANRVIFLGKVPYLDLLEYTAACDIGWLVIRGHGISNQLALPNKLFEYAIMGLPIISSSLKNMRDIIKKYNLGFVVDDGDINDQLNAVEKINSGALQNNKKNVSKLSWDVQHNTFIGLISE